MLPPQQQSVPLPLFLEAKPDHVDALGLDDEGVLASMSEHMQTDGLQSTAHQLMETIWKGKQTNKQTTCVPVTKVNKQTNKQAGAACAEVWMQGVVWSHITCGVT